MYHISFAFLLLMSCSDFLQHIRLFATKHLGSLIRGSTTANAWTLRLLLTQLYDPSTEVRGVAVQFLEEVCEDSDVLQTVVEMQPTLDHLGQVGHPLLLKLVNTLCLDTHSDCQTGSCRHLWDSASCMPATTSIVRWISGSMWVRLKNLRDT